ncbi:ABC-type glycerol-3-phosphate transport system substrate-binding protein [Paenibacillus taihuensis]|uniref:ABC-type glycerol-3-phosphate transport system substrate-binding protein n=1 Tax=Paenibacillus taihuensis TaxID=1156355 RepID=A0A3D9QW03_9BACL|nr:ABC transporter substrate-binding protein [Paenibacillus taihuensis]REE69577.1 ABC-type glycerol-3-phosphate transport system substrate-binding protein [Paenibacillus taihuensis]
MKLKGLSALASVLLLTTAVSACGGSNNGNNQGNSSSDTSTNTSSNSSTNSSGNNAAATDDTSSNASTDNSGSNAAAAGNDKEFTIRVGAWFLDDRPYMVQFKKDVETAYAKLYPKAKIQWDVVLGATYFDKLKAQFASGSAPDVVFYQGVDFAKSGNLQDLSAEPWVARLNTGGQKDFQTHADGKTFGVPMGLSIGGGVWYNKKIFSDLGIQAPKTTQELMDAAEKIKTSGKTPITLGFKDQWTASLFYFNWLNSYQLNDPTLGQKVYSGEQKINDDALIQKVYQNFEQMKSKGYFNKNAISIDWPQSGQMFASGEAAMIVQGPWMPGANADNINKGGFEKFDIGYFPLANDDGKVAMGLGSNEALGVNAKTELMQESKDLVNLITSADIISPFMKGDGALTSFTDVTVQYDDPVMNDVQAAVDNSTVVTSNLTNFIPASAATNMLDLLTKVVSGVKFNADDLKPAQASFDKDKATVSPPAE